MRARGQYRRTAFSAFAALSVLSACGWGADVPRQPVAGVRTNSVPQRVVVLHLGTPASPEALKEALAALGRKMGDLNEQEKAANAPPMPIQLVLAPVPFPPATNVEQALHQTIAQEDRRERRELLLPPETNAPPASTNALVFPIKGYEVIGNTLLSTDLVELILQPYIGTNITFEKIKQAVVDLRTVYRDRGYITVSAFPPEQKLTNGIVKIEVFQGRLAEILVVSNRFFSSNNVMRALPGLHEGLILESPVFQSELDRANANPDRQIWPQIEPGPEENTTTLKLQVKDQLPLHAKLDFDNYNTPDTPALRVNTSAVYNNLWQLQHSLGVQYSFSPEDYKVGESWNFYDKPAIANYSAFYRFPLGNPEPVETVVARNPNNFGYNEATRRFNLPPSTGQPEFNIYASRSTIDTGIEDLGTRNLFSTNGNSLDEQTVHQDLTESSDIGCRLSLPLEATPTSLSSVSGGLDFKTYQLKSAETNIFTLTTSEVDNNTAPPTTNIVVSKNSSPVPFTTRYIEYLPLSLRYDISGRDALGTTSFGLGLGGNVWYDSLTTIDSATTNIAIRGRKSVELMTGSSQSSGYWFVLNPSLSRDFNIHTNWNLSLHLDGQWADQPLISNEQYGIGGVSSVRGYHQGEVFGDTGWQVLCEQKTPSHLVGMVGGTQPLTIRASVYMGYGETYLIDTPKGSYIRNGQLWGTGFGGAASIGSHWEARFLCSWPLLSTPTTQAYQPRFDFSLVAQF